MTLTTTVERESSIEHVRELVQRHRVCWEVYPETLKTADGLRRAGYALEIFGTHDHPISPITPGCSQCRSVHRDLLEIAQWICPRDRRDSRHDIDAYEAALEFSPKRKFRRDVRLVIRITHRSGFDAPIDQCEMRCLAEMKEKLKQAGARPDRW